MLRNIFRTSQRLAHRQINIYAPVITLRCSRIRIQKSFDVLNTSRRYSVSSPNNAQFSDQVEPAVFEEICNETLESLCDYFEELVEQSSNFKGADITYSDGVLTVSLGPPYGTYVINRQTPNKQIWLSSPVSGPKRYDLVLKDGGFWTYKHDGVTLHQLLQTEISKIITKGVDFKQCAHSGKE